MSDEGEERNSAEEPDERTGDRDDAAADARERVGDPELRAGRERLERIERIGREGLERVVGEGAGRLRPEHVEREVREREAREREERERAERERAEREAREREEREPRREPGLDPALEKQCAQLLRQLRRRCPHLIPAERLPAGEVAQPLELEAKEVEDVVRTALGASAEAPSFLWADGDSELLVHAARTRVTFGDGLVLVSLTVECEQTGRAEVVVAFAVGSDARAAGMVAATETRPRGPAILVDRWGDAITAAAWKALLDSARALSARAGSDADGARLIPGAISARPGGLVVTPQARHVFDRDPVL